MSASRLFSRKSSSNSCPFTVRFLVPETGSLSELAGNGAREKGRDNRVGGGLVSYLKTSHSFTEP